MSKDIPPHLAAVLKQEDQSTYTPAPKQDLPMAGFDAVSTVDMTQREKEREERQKMFGSPVSRSFHSTMGTIFSWISPFVFFVYALFTFGTKASRIGKDTWFLFGLMFVICVILFLTIKGLRTMTLKDGILTMKGWRGQVDEVPIEDVLGVDCVYIVGIFVVPTNERIGSRVMGRVQLKQPAASGRDTFFFVPKGLFSVSSAISDFQNEVTHAQTMRDVHRRNPGRIGPF